MGMLQEASRSQEGAGALSWSAVTGRARGPNGALAEPNGSPAEPNGALAGRSRYNYFLEYKAEKLNIESKEGI